MRSKSSRIRAVLGSRPWVLLGAALLVLFAVVKLWRAESAPSPPPTMTAERRDIEKSVLANGTLQPRVKLDVGAQVTGQIRSLEVHLGEHVRKGQDLARLDPELARNEIRQASALLGQQQSIYKSRLVDLEQAIEELRRQEVLIAGDGTSTAEYSQAGSMVAKLKAELAGMEALLEKLQADVDTATLRLGYTRITAPMDGDVVSIAVQEGQIVNAQQQTPTLLTLANLDVMTVKARVPEADVSAIHVGQAASFTTLGDSRRRYRGQVKLIQPLPERVNNALFYNVLFDVDNADRSLMSEMSVQVALEVAKANAVVAIPVAAVGEPDSGGQYTVRILSKNGESQPKKVHLGVSDNHFVEVTEGIQAGDQILIELSKNGN